MAQNGTGNRPGDVTKSDTKPDTELRKIAPKIGLEMPPNVLKKRTELDIGRTFFSTVRSVR
jgi:hypothetical protein